MLLNQRQQTFEAGQVLLYVSISKIVILSILHFDKL